MCSCICQSLAGSCTRYAESSPSELLLPKYPNNLYARMGVSSGSQTCNLEGVQKLQAVQPEFKRADGHIATAGLKFLFVLLSPLQRWLQVMR